MEKLLKYLCIYSCLLILHSCYPISTGSMKWRIKWDKDLKKGKEAFTENISSESISKKNKPNIIILLADDLGKGEVSAYGAQHIETPNIDQIGKEGVIFEEGYVTAPTCAPSRAGIMTGRVQNRYGFETQLMEFYPTNVIEYLTGKYIVNTGDFVVATKPRFPREWHIHKQGVPPTEINLAEILKTYGYKTGITGKWHLGASKEHLPWKRGFDYHYGFNGAFSWFTPEEHWTGIINHYHDSFSAKHQWENGRSGEGAITKKEKVIREDKYLTFAIKDQAIDFIKANKDEPFFLYCSFSAPHVPFQAPVDYYCQYSHIEDNNKRVYYAMISALDDAIGEIHKTIKDLGIEENTIIYFLSDNGGATYTGATTNGNLKGGKLTQFEGGINVPFMMKWKGKIKEGIRYKKPISSTDIFTTSVKSFDGKLPKDRTYDGKNLIPYVNGTINEQPHEQLFWRADHLWAMRDGKYKFIMSTRDGWAELYDLESDKSEKFNLKDKMPDLFETIKKKHEEWQTELPEKPMWPRIMDHKFVFDGKEYLFPA